MLFNVVDTLQTWINVAIWSLDYWVSQLATDWNKQLHNYVAMSIAAVLSTTSYRYQDQCSTYELTCWLHGQNAKQEHAACFCIASHDSRVWHYNL